MKVIYQKQWEFLKRNFESGNLAHAFLFSGQDVDLIISFVKEFIKLINCLSPNYNGRQNQGIGKAVEAPNKCQNCKMIENGIFTDLIVIKSADSPSSKKNEKDMMEISVEQVRDAQSFLSYKAYYGNFKLLIIENADRMNVEAQSAFLKTLEEPKGKTIMFLITSKADLLLPTIFSRCQQLKFLGKATDDKLGSDQKVMNDLKRVLSSDLAEKFNFIKNTNLEEENFNNILHGLQNYWRNELLNKIGLGGKTETDYSVEKIKNIIRLIDKISYQANLYNINQKLALEIILIES